MIYLRIYLIIMDVDAWVLPPRDPSRSRQVLVTDPPGRSGGKNPVREGTGG